MNGACPEFDRHLESGPPASEREASWREHLAGCADCRGQELADALLRRALAGEAPELSAAFDARLRRRLEERAADRAAAPAARRPGALRPSGLWALSGYGTGAVAASVAILARLPWESFSPSPWLGIALGAVALVSPLALLDRVGLIRPPG